jgi:hypothetical protein
MLGDAAGACAREGIGPTTPKVMKAIAAATNAEDTRMVPPVCAMLVDKRAAVKLRRAYSRLFVSRKCV